MTDTPSTDPDRQTEESAGDVIDTAFIALLSDALANRDQMLLRESLLSRHPADAADALEQLGFDDLMALAVVLREEFPADVLIEMRADERVQVLDALSDAGVRKVVESLDSDDAATLMNDLSEDRQALILASLPRSDRTGLEQSLAFDDETAGRLMQREFVAAPEYWTVGQTVDHARLHGEELPDIFFNIYVVDPAFRLSGVVPLYKLLRSQRSAKLLDIMEAVEAEVKPEMDQEEVAYLFQKYHLVSAPVVDASGRLTGMITVDDMVDVIQEENREDLLALSGVTEQESTDSLRSTLRSRTPWLLVNLVTAFIASGVISLFDRTLDQIVALAILMPVVAALGGNAGSQALAVTVRALSERELNGLATGRAIRREFLAGLINGILFAAAVALIAWFWFQDPRLSGAMAIAMLLTFIWSGLAGILIPLAMRKLGADPAVASSVFLLTTVDVVGFLSFLGLATLFLL